MDITITHRQETSKVHFRQLRGKSEPLGDRSTNGPRDFSFCCLEIYVEADTIRTRCWHTPHQEKSKGVAPRPLWLVADQSLCAKHEKHSNALVSSGGSAGTAFLRGLGAQMVKQWLRI